MAHFAKVNNGIVEQVIVAEPEFFDKNPDQLKQLIGDIDPEKFYNGICKSLFGYKRNRRCYKTI